MKFRIFFFITVAAMITAVALTAEFFLSGSASAAQTVPGAAIDPTVKSWGLVAAALVAGLATLGAGHAVAIVGSAGIGAITEKPELVGRVLIFVGLAEGIAIYGLIVAILILNRTG